MKRMPRFLASFIVFLAARAMVILCFLASSFRSQKANQRPLEYAKPPIPIISPSSSPTHANVVGFTGMFEKVSRSAAEALRRITFAIAVLNQMPTIANAPKVVRPRRVLDTRTFVGGSNAHPTPMLYRGLQQADVLPLALQKPLFIAMG